MNIMGESYVVGQPLAQGATPLASAMNWRVDNIAKPVDRFSGESRQVLASTFIPLRERRAEWDARRAMVQRARAFLYSSTYYVGPDMYGQTMLRDLGDAAQRGVRTTLLIDRCGQWLGSSAWGPRGTRAVWRWLKDAERRGVRIVWTTPACLADHLIGGGHHVKIQLCEDGPALFASSNLSRHSFEVWGEFAALLDGPIVATLLSALQTKLPAGEPRDRISDRAPGDDPIAMRWLWCDPSATPALTPRAQRRSNPVTTGLIDTVAAARHSVQVSSFYVKPEPGLRAAMLEAAGRGVRVEVFHSGPDGLDGTEAPWLAAAVDYPALMARGVAVYEVRGGEHSKLMLADGRALFGSYNLDHAAHDVVAEAMLASEDERVVSAVRDVFDALRADPLCHRVGRPREAWGVKRRLHARLVRPFRRWL